VIRTRARTVSVAAAAALAVAALSGCGAGLGADTSTPYTATLGTDAVVGNMYVDNVVVVDDGSEPELLLTLINQGRETDTLMSIQMTQAESVSVPSGGVDITPSNFVLFGPTGTERALVTGLTAPLGHVVTVRMLFRIAGSVDVQAMVTTPQNLYAGS
jgi:hypothetical protein